MIRQFTLVTLCSFALVASASALTVAEITDVSPNVDEVPSPVRTFVPEYPDSLRNAKVAGLVTVMIVIDESGDVIAAEVVKTSHDDFSEPAVAAVRRWKFKPAKLDGKSVKVKVTIPVRFTTS